MVSQPKPTMTYAEYLDFERKSEVRHEYLRGEVLAMAGGTPSHALLQASCVRLLGNALQGRPCGVYSSDLRVRIRVTDRSTYPDVTVVCGKRETADDDDDAVTNPVLIVEILSVSTEASDRGEKFEHYRRLSSLQEYVLVNHARRQVEVFQRGIGRRWELSVFDDGEVVELKSLDVRIEVATIYTDPNA